MAGLPSKYVDVTTALATRGVVSVIALVVDVWGGAFQSKGTSSCITFTVKDTNLNNGHTWDGLKVKYFKDVESLLPPVREGDVVLLQNLWVRMYNGRPLAVAPEAQNVPWAVFRPDRDPTAPLSALTGPVPFEPSYAEKTYASQLLSMPPSVFRNETSATRQNLAPALISKSTPSVGRRFSLLQDVQERQYVDLVGEIVKIFDQHSDRVEMYFTDYTTNPRFFHYTADPDGDQGREGDPHNYLGRPNTKWKGPFGQMTIQITLWEPHASYLRGHFKENEIVRLKNVRIKQNRVGQLLEGSLHTNHDNADAVNISPVDMNSDERVKQFTFRRTEYWDANPSRRKPKQAPELSSKKVSSSKKTNTKPERKREEGQKTLETSKRSNTNSHISAGHPAVQTKPLEWILDDDRRKCDSPDGINYVLPFQNICYRTTIRVVDFFPPRIEDFAVPEEDDSLEANEDTPPRSSRAFTRWQWQFVLLVENGQPPPPGNPKKSMELFVFGHDAVHLLQEDPVNLRENPAMLSKVREKLFILWGDLEERKRRALDQGGTAHSFLDIGSSSSVPFTCCVKEYGIKCEHSPADPASRPGDDDISDVCSEEGCFGWEKRFALFSTTIKC